MKMSLEMDDNAVEWQERHLAPGRKAEPIAMRRSWARLDSLLSPSMRDARDEITQAYQDQLTTDLGDYLGYRSPR